MTTYFQKLKTRKCSANINFVDDIVVAGFGPTEAEGLKNNQQKLSETLKRCDDMNIILNKDNQQRKRSSSCSLHCRQSVYIDPTCILLNWRTGVDVGEGVSLSPTKVGTVNIAPSTPVCLSIHLALQTKDKSKCVQRFVRAVRFNKMNLFFLLGTCVDLNNYTCNCYVGFTGPHCDIKIANCTYDSCYRNVTCFKISETISCGPCPFGLSGDGKNCEGDTENKKIGHIILFNVGLLNVKYTL